MATRRNAVERLFQRLTGIRRILSRFAKRVVIFLGSLRFALIFHRLRSCEYPPCVRLTVFVLGEAVRPTLM